MREVDEPRDVGQIRRLIETGLQQDVDLLVAQPIGADHAKHRPRHAEAFDFAALHRQQPLAGALVAGDQLELEAEHPLEHRPAQLR